MKVNQILYCRDYFIDDNRIKYKQPKLGHDNIIILVKVIIVISIMIFQLPSAISYMPITYLHTVNNEKMSSDSSAQIVLANIILILRLYECYSKRHATEQSIRSIN